MVHPESSKPGSAQPATCPTMSGSTANCHAPARGSSEGATATREPEAAGNGEKDGGTGHAIATEREKGRQPARPISITRSIAGVTAATPVGHRCARTSAGSRHLLGDCRSVAPIPLTATPAAGFPLSEERSLSMYMISALLTPRGVISTRLIILGWIGPSRSNGRCLRPVALLCFPKIRSASMVDRDTFLTTRTEAQWMCVCAY